MAYTVKAVADLAGVSIRTLHHYDDIGLLTPAAVSPTGYRMYSDADLERLQQVLFFRELGFSLQEIGAIIDSPGFDKRQALITHKKLLHEKQERLQTLIRSVDRTIDAMERGNIVDKNEMFEGFDVSKMEEYREEARAKYGKEVVDESDRRTSKYTQAEWATIQADMNEINQAMASLMDKDPADPEVQGHVDRWFRMINDRFYTCTPEIFRGLGDLYVDDSRFTANYDKVKPGLAAFMRAAMHAYCDRLAGNK